jgi:hypothetical protein
MKTDVNYQRDVRMHIRYEKDGKWTREYLVQGMGVMPYSSQYKIKVFPPGKADMITVTSCHREIKTPNPEKSGGGWFKKGHYEFTVPLQGTVDDSELCSFDIGVYEKNKGRHAWGTFAINDGKAYRLNATTKCNGRFKPYGGVSVCQAKKGLIQEYSFDRLVSVAAPVGCEISNLASKDRYAKVWRFLMPPGECEIFFIDVKNPRGFQHQAFFFGYDSIPIRGIQ